MGAPSTLDESRLGRANWARRCAREHGVSTGEARAEELAAAGAAEMEELAAARREEGGCAGRGAGGGGDRSGRRGGQRLGGEVAATGVGGSGLGRFC